VRVVVMTQVPPIAAAYIALASALGHDVPAVIAGRPVAASPDDFLEAVGDGTDVLFPASKHALAPLLRVYEPDVALCTGFPWLVPQEAIDVPRLGIVNGHPTMLPKGRGPYPWAWAIRNGDSELGLTYHFMDATFDTGNVVVQKPIPIDPDDTEETLIPKFPAAAAELVPQVFAKLEAGERGTPQGEGEYQHPFEPEYAVVDLDATAADVHRQVRAWSFIPERLRVGPVVERNGTKVRLVRTSVTEVDGAQPLECADGPLWIVESVPV
jgi:methionyl-tRNA formyltransferase